jgi:predicted phage terminase large subunit-like protein
MGGTPKLPYGEILRAAQEELDAIEAEQAKRSLLFFVRTAWDIVEPERSFTNNWHIEELCKLLESVTAGKVRRAIVNIPPGTMKSLLVSVFWPAWEMANNPKRRYLTASYGSHLTIRDNLRFRDIVQSAWYQKHYSVEFTTDQNAKELLKTTEGGWRFATSVGGAGTGEHPDRIIIDDPHTAEQARSAVERDRAAMWFDRTASSRGVMRDVAILLIMQRLDEMDLTGHLLAKGGGWEHICFPMRFEPARKDPRDPRTKEGQLLWPKLLPEEKVAALELDLGPYGTAGQLQQRPAPEGGGLFQREWFRIVDASPSVARRVRGWDTAGTDGGGDYTVGVKMAEVNGQFFVEDVVRGQWGPSGVDAVILQTTHMDGPKCAQREEREGGSAGIAVIAARAKSLVGADYQGVSTTGSKVVRSKPYRSQCAAGNVFLVRGDWNEAYISELCTFPTGRHDDQVDGSSAAFNAVLLEPVLDGSLVW